MDESKVNFLYPPSQTQQQISFNSPQITLPHDLSSFNTQRQQVTLSQIYTSRKIKHPSFRKRASSGSMPYYIPFRHRQRTKSESQENGQSNEQQLASMEYENTTMEIQYTASQYFHNNHQYNKIKVVQLKKSKSLESLSPTKECNKDLQKEQNFSTMEFFDINHRIQKLNLVHHD